MSDNTRGVELAAVQIRRAEPDDADLLATLGARTFAETFGADNTTEDMAAYISTNFTPARLAEELADGSTTFLIAEIEDTPGGYAKLRWSDAAPDSVPAARPMVLSRIYVASEWLGRRVGAALMQRCIEEAQSSGADLLWLGVWERNERAISFYEKWGFSKVGEHEFTLGSDRQTDWVMARSL